MNFVLKTKEEVSNDEIRYGEGGIYIGKKQNYLAIGKSVFIQSQGDHYYGLFKDGSLDGIGRIIVKVMENIIGQTVLITKDNGIKVNVMAKESIIIAMVLSMLEIGKKTIVMAKEHIQKKMVKS